MKKQLTVIVLLCSILTSIFAQEDKTVTLTVIGQGETLDAAKQNAIRSAIEQAFGTFISAKTDILNDKLISEEITSVTTGNIQKYDLLSQTQLAENNWVANIKATVSIDKLTSFAESKGVTVEFKGAIFASNVKIQLLNEKAEQKSIDNLISIIDEPLKKGFNYKLQVSEPKATDASSQNWELIFKIDVLASKNLEQIFSLVENTLASISLSSAEIETYKSLGKSVWGIPAYSKINQKPMDKQRLLDSLINEGKMQYKALYAGESKPKQIEKVIAQYESHFKSVAESKLQTLINQEVRNLKETGDLSVRVYFLRSEESIKKLTGFFVSHWDNYISNYKIQSGDIIICGKNYCCAADQRGAPAYGMTGQLYCREYQVKNYKGEDYFNFKKICPSKAVTLEKNTEEDKMDFSTFPLILYSENEPVSIANMILFREGGPGYSGRIGYPRYRFYLGPIKETFKLSDIEKMSEFKISPNSCN